MEFMEIGTMKKEYQQCPRFMLEDIYEIEFALSEKDKERVWNALQLRETFTKGQIFPFRVEFASGEERGAFLPAEQNIHHGPFLHLPGEIGIITNEYRSLFYYFGSYVISFRLIRPICLEFFKTDTGIKMKLKSFVVPFFRSIWRLGNKVFWQKFGITFLFKA